MTRPTPPHVIFLRAELERRKSKNRLFSLRAFAKLMGQHPSAMSRILNSKQELSIPAAQKIMKKLGLTPEEQESFIVSVANQRYQLALSALVDNSDAGSCVGSLRASEERYRPLFALVVHAVQLLEVVRDQSGKTVDLRLLRANEVWEKWTGLKCSEVAGKKLSGYLPELPTEWLAAFDEAGTSGLKIRGDHRFETAQWLDITIEATIDDRFIVQSIDITERKRKEEELQQTEQHMSSITGLVPQLLWRCDRDGRTVWYNQRWLDYTGQALEQSLGWGRIATIHPSERKKTSQRYLQAVENGSSFHEDQRILGTDGEYRWFSVHTVPRFGEDGRVTCMYSCATATRERKLAVGEPE